jgi:hypothetical protein
MGFSSMTRIFRSEEALAAEEADTVLRKVQIVAVHTMEEFRRHCNQAAILAAICPLNIICAEVGVLPLCGEDRDTLVASHLQPEMLVYKLTKTQKRIGLPH